MSLVQSVLIMLFVYIHALNELVLAFCVLLCIGHGAELPFLFGTISLAGYEFTADEAKLSNSVMYYWSNFVKYGNPNGFSAEVYNISFSLST